MKSIILKTALLINHFFLILHMSWLINEGSQLSIKSIAPMLLSSIMLIDSTYISACNIRESKILSLFSGLLALDGWYILLSFETVGMANLAFLFLSPVIWYISIKFVFMFLFQESGYKFRKTTNILLLALCIGSLVGATISERAFACMYGLQFVGYILCVLFVIAYHRKRVAFVLISERKAILLSFVAIGVSFFVYYFATLGITDHIENFAVYLIVILFSMSVHNIILKEHNGSPLSTVFSHKQRLFISLLLAAILGLLVWSMGAGYAEWLISVNVLSVVAFVCNIVLGQNLKHGETGIIKESKYKSALRQLQQEEALKTEFANFLHDDVLQDLLAVKNMVSKAYRPDIQDVITETLDNLNIHIREQMQDYHPVLLKNLTIKENYMNLIEAVAQGFPQKNVSISFECPDSLFLVEPYTLLVYRLIKELLTNVYKHSDGDCAWVTLLQEKAVIKLRISDNGTAELSSLTAVDPQKHKGIVSVSEQVKGVGGTMVCSANIPHGICIEITIPMKGDGSYQYFVS